MKRTTKVLILISISLIILAAVFVVSFNHTEETASAEISNLQAGVEYLVPMQPISNSTSANWQTSGNVVSESIAYFSGNYTVYVDGTALFSSNLVTFERQPNAYVRYRLKQSSSMLLYIYFQGNTWFYSVTGADVAGKTVSIVFTSITASSTSTGFNPTRFGYFKQDLLKVLSPLVLPPEQLTLDAGFYFLEFDTQLLNIGDTIDFNYTAYWCEENSWDNQSDFTGISCGYPFGPATDKRIYLYDENDQTNYKIISDNYGNLNVALYLLSDYEQVVTANAISQGLYLVPRGAVSSLLATYNTGFNDGLRYELVSGGVTSVINSIFSGLFGSLFNIEIFPGFKLYIFLLIPVVFAIVGLLLWLIRGK